MKLAASIRENPALVYPKSKSGYRIKFASELAGKTVM